jgi:hypothetical protein
MASWWLLWEDLIFPENGIEEKVVKQARKFKEAGIDTVVIFGCHFRWDYIYNWERFHNLLKFIVDTCHKEEIKVFDHHSANLVHRVSNAQEYSNISRTNRHHVPFFPSREFADTITFDGHKLNDFRMVSVQDGKPCYLSSYNAEIFCMNNTDFVKAYQKYLKELLKTGIDGLMPDDVIYYPGWKSCGCKFCREKFKNNFGHDLPPTSNEDFWGNYESPAFKDWLDMRYHDSLDFLNAVKETVGVDFPLMSCCSTSSLKVLDGSGMNAIIMSRALNNIMLEMCGEIVSEKSDYLEHISDLMLHKAVAANHNYPNIGLGYAHNKDSAFVIWALNKIFTSNCWISTLTGRLGVSENTRKLIPDEADIIKEAYGFEKQHQDLFKAESSARLAILFSLENLVYNGCTQDDYSQPWRNITQGLFRKNIQFDVVTDIPCPEKYPVLLLSNFDCISEKDNAGLIKYMKDGGTIIASGLLGFRNERGVLKEKSFLSYLGAEFKSENLNWNLPSELLFKSRQCCFEPDKPYYNIYQNGEKVAHNQWITHGSLHWLPQNNAESVIEMAEKIIPHDNVEVECPEGWIYRILSDNSGKTFIHFLAIDIKPVPYENFRNNIINQPVIEKLEFKPSQGEISIKSKASNIVLYSPDITEPVKLEIENNQVSFDSGKIKRYMVIELF